MSKMDKIAKKMYLCQNCGKESKGTEIRIDEQGYEHCPECDAFVVGIDTVERERRAKAAKRAKPAKK